MFVQKGSTEDLGEVQFFPEKIFNLPVLSLLWETETCKWPYLTFIPEFLKIS